MFMLIEASIADMRLFLIVRVVHPRIALAVIQLVPIAVARQEVQSEPLPFVFLIIM